MSIQHIDCTLRDGGYYNAWDFSKELISEYLFAMEAADVDFIELGFRSFDAKGFRGACAYTTDSFINGLQLPARAKIGVMVNAAEVVKHALGAVEATKLLFAPASRSNVKLVRFACHVHEFESTLPACEWLKSAGYQVGINLMQVADRSDEEIENIGQVASKYALDALYFADSMGSLNPDQTAHIVQLLRRQWKGPLGIHTHDNMGCALANTLRAMDEGVSWVDSTVTGMGRGPGNAKTEYLVIELEKRRGKKVNIAPLLALIRNYFGPMQHDFGWGSNPYYYLAGQYGIHPTYVQEMLGDPRYGEAEILSVIEHLQKSGGKKFNVSTMEAGRQLYGGESSGSWQPSGAISGREVLILGTGPGASTHREAIEQYIRLKKPFVIALNTQTPVDPGLINIRAACQPFRLIADRAIYKELPQPLVVPLARLHEAVKDSLKGVKVFDFGLVVKPNEFEFYAEHAVTPSSLVIAYALAIAVSGNAKSISLAGFDGFSADDPRSAEMDNLLRLFCSKNPSMSLQALTPTRYKVPTSTVYSMIN